MKNNRYNTTVKLKIKKSVIFATGIILLATSCAYFNTFYNAQTSYKKAMKAKQISPEHKPPADLLDKVIEKCGKIVKYYPESRWVDDAISLMGKAYLEKGDYDKALRKFEELMIYYPESPFVNEAIYLTGVTYFNKDDYNLAIGYFNQLAKDKNSKFADDAYYMIIKTLSKKKDYNTMLDKAQEFVTNFQRSPHLPRVLLLMGEVNLENKRFSTAIKNLRLASKLAKNREDKNDIDEKYAVALIKTGRMKEGLSLLKSLLEKSNTEKRAADLTFEMVDAYLLGNDAKSALKELESFIAVYPNGIYAAEAFYRKGLIYEEELGDIESALTAYETVPKLNPSEDILQIANKRSNILKALKEYREEISHPDSSINLAKAHFLLAETYLFGKSNADTALIEYNNVLDSFPESPFAKKSMFAIAWIYEKNKRDTALALNMYKKIVEKFPNTEFARVAETAIGRLSSLKDTTQIKE